MSKPPVTHVPPDSAEYLSGPMPKYADGKFTVNGKEIDANDLPPIDEEKPTRRGSDGRPTR